MKTESILLLYDTLLKGETVWRSEFCADHSVSERTFYRYIYKVSAFLRKHKSDYVIDVTAPDGKYFMEICRKS